MALNKELRGIERIPESMRAAVYRGKGNVKVERVAVPAIGPDEILVRVAYCGVCPTDVKKILHGTQEPPRIYGHETSGTVVKVGRKVHGWRPGDRVGLHHHVPCMHCHCCRHRAFAQCQQYKRTGITAGFEPAGGGFSEYVRVMSFVLPGVVKVPRNGTLLQAAFLEPVNTVLKGVRRLPLRKGDHVWVVGQGPIGLMFTRLLALQGCSVSVSDPLEARLRKGRQMGGRHFWNPARQEIPGFWRKIRKKGGFDAVVLTVAGSGVVAEAMQFVRGGGKVLLFAHTKRGEEAALDLARVCMDEKDLLGSYSSDFTLQAEVAKLVFSGQMGVEGLVSNLLPLERVAEAMDRSSAPCGKSLKLVVQAG